MLKWFPCVLLILLVGYSSTVAATTRETLINELSALDSERMALIQTAEEIANDAQLETVQKISKLEALEQRASEIRTKRLRLKNLLSERTVIRIPPPESGELPPKPPLSPSTARASIFEILLSGIIWIAVLATVSVGAVMIAEKMEWISQGTAQKMHHRIQAGIRSIRKMFETPVRSSSPQRGRISDGEVPRHLA